MGDREQLLRDIGIADFVLTELTMYLDTHPYDRKAMEYFNHYNRIKLQMEREFSQKYYPLNTRWAEILKKLVNIEYLALNKKTQALAPTLMGEMIYDVVGSSIKALLDPSLTASWEKGLTLVADGNISSQEYMDKLAGFVGRRTEYVKQLNNQGMLYARFQEASANYKM